MSELFAGAKKAEAVTRGRPLTWPRPFAMHWGMAAMGIMQGHMMLHMLQSGHVNIEELPVWHQFDEQVKSYLLSQDNNNPQNSIEIAQSASDKMMRFQAQVERYRNYPLKRTGSRFLTIMDQGSVRLLHLKTEQKAREKHPILLVPSLINQFHIMDLREGNSLVQYFSQNGHDVYVVDWGDVSEEEKDYGLADYIEILEAFAEEIVAKKGALNLLGYCMGGVLTLGLLHILKVTNTALFNAIGKSVLMATPWNFHAVRREHARFVGLWADQFFREGLEAPLLGPDMQHCLFMALDPLVVLKKYEQFEKMADHSDAAMQFVLVEDWVNDGVSVTRKVAKECLGDWYGRNEPFHNKWKLAGHDVRLDIIDTPVLMVSASRDRLIPPEMSQPLLERLQHAQALSVDTGHVGLMVGRRAEADCWGPICQFLSQ